MEGTNNKQTNRKNITITSSSSSSNDEGMMFIRKGPWKAEEDQVLLNHVKKYGPRDWSSIRSKGLLHRTGKSCRLRWVNKLRPNLKNGCKLTAEEERVVIEMQAQLGNKWATIATQLPGRTDNDVKNFWSSRQKRLARLLHSQSPSGLPHESHKPSISSLSSTSCTAKRPPDVPDSNSVMEGETSYTSPNTAKMILPSSEMVNQNSVNSEANNKIMVKLEPTPLNMRYPATEKLQFQEMPFPPIPNLQTDLFPFPPETQELIDRLDSSFLGPLGCTDDAAFLSDGAHLFSCFGGGDLKGDTGVTPDSFFDDFPSDMFDQIEPLPSPSGW